MNKRFFVIITCAIAILVCNYTFVFSDSSKIIREILKMHESGLNEETILIYLQSRDTVLELTSKDLIRLKNAGFSEEFIQALLQIRKMPDYDAAPPIYDYGSSYFSYSFGFNYGCIPFSCNSSPCKVWGQFSANSFNPTMDQKRYFYSGGHAFVRHNGHFHLDDDHRFQTKPNLNLLPENAFISRRAGTLNSGNASFKAVSTKNRWSEKFSTSTTHSTFGTKTAAKTSRPAGSFHALRSGKAGNKIGFGGTKVSNK